MNDYMPHCGVCGRYTVHYSRERMSVAGCPWLGVDIDYYCPKHDPREKAGQ